MHDKIKEEITTAMRARNAVRLTTLRGVLSAFTNESVALKRTPQDKLSDNEATAVIRRLVKQRKDSIEQFEKAGRQELADNEKAELTILEEFLPAQMSEEVIRKIVAEIIQKTPGETNRGKIMGAVMKETGGNADGALVKKIVEEAFS